MVRSSLHQNIRQNNIGQDEDRVRKMAQGIITRGTESVLTRKNVSRIVTEILDEQSHLRDRRTVFLTELSPTLLCTLIALRSVYQRNLRKEVFDYLVPKLIQEIND